MIAKKDIEEILDINESYKLTGRLMEILQDQEKREDIFDEFLKREQDLSFDWFTDYFQDEQGDRKGLKQDYTPDCLCEIVMKLCDGEGDVISDICAGTGGLTIKAWNKNKNAFFHCEELSQRAVAILLFNLAIRNITGQVVHGDVLTGKTEAIYSLKTSIKYSEIERKQTAENVKANISISNPPYSIGWDSVDDFKNDSRFREYGLPPKSKADYGFVLHGISTLKPSGTLIEILPHGVLFRGAKEAEIRRKLVDGNLLKTVIGLPNNLFLNTGIPVAILVFQKDRKESDTLFIDCSKDFEKNGKQNLMNAEHIDRLIKACKERREIPKYSHIATRQEIEENDFNLNIPRYVDTYERMPAPDLLETITELHAIDREIQKTELRLMGMMKQMTGTTAESDKKYQKSLAAYERYIKGKYAKAEEQVVMEFET